MKVQFNGKNIDLQHSLTLSAFLKERAIDLQTGGIAVAINGQIVSRDNWTTTLIKENDIMEIVHAVSGG